ncbi:hypothetical protein PGTUg99_034325 [Puccinia graminis f. sp. tritici]|uniref:Uncharacterized protein n=1 Tax=Puccinia graminis f. sp. tritici TaxID=56615 RepID=A0A5B0S1L4_PUCGR|nr:hypothetical protein PGTUg99_034325 [Puccinia graminis f. sp. tritici]
MIRLAPGSGAGSALSRPAGPDRIRHILVGSFHKRSVVSSVQYGVRFGRSRLGAAEFFVELITSVSEEIARFVITLRPAASDRSPVVPVQSLRNMYNFHRHFL